jgi:ferredoxin-fold anticodon binding domain-containing protein
MENIYDGERITIDYNDIEETYRISLFDKHLHYLEEFILDKEQYNELKENFNK